MKKMATQIKVHLENLQPVEAEYLRRIIEIFADPKNATLRAALIKNQLAPRVLPNGRTAFIPSFPTPTPKN